MPLKFHPLFTFLLILDDSKVDHKKTGKTRIELYFEGEEFNGKVLLLLPMGKERFCVNPFPELRVQREQLKENAERELPIQQKTVKSRAQGFQ